MYICTSKNLTYANLSHADLMAADLSEADLSHADLMAADLSEADLAYANLSLAYLSLARLTAANLSHADLSWANLMWTDLENANLSWARLTWTNLENANLTGANLVGTCLDPRNAVPITDLSEFVEYSEDTDFLIGHRTKNSPMLGGPGYECGHEYVAPHFSTSIDTPCHPGLYVRPEKKPGDITVVFLRVEALRARDKYRVKRFLVMMGDAERERL